MRKIYGLLAAASVLLVACQKEKDVAPAKTKTELLTGGSTKQWQYTLTAPGTFCPNSNRFHADNTYTFAADNKMTFHHGTVTEKGNCENFTNYEGTWAFSRNEDSLMVYATRRSDNGASLGGLLLWKGKIQLLEATRLVVEFPQQGIEFTPR